MTPPTVTPRKSHGTRPLTRPLRCPGGTSATTPLPTPRPQPAAPTIPCALRDPALPGDRGVRCRTGTPAPEVPVTDPTAPGAHRREGDQQGDLEYDEAHEGAAAGRGGAAAP